MATMAASSLKSRKPRFLVDAMLIKLGRWLRILGYGCRIPEKDEIDDDKLLSIAKKEKRTLITMDRELSKRGRGSVKIFYIPSSVNSITKQLEFLIKKKMILHPYLNEDIESFLDKNVKCTKCGGELRKINKKEIVEMTQFSNVPKSRQGYISRKSRNRIPIKGIRTNFFDMEIPIDELAKRYNEFWVCRKCNKIYWKGSHWKKMIETIGSIEKKQTRKNK